MASELPYFRFTVQEWQNGDISLERFELQGLFISVCGFYWLQDCNCTLALMQKKFNSAKPELMELIELGIIKLDKKTDLLQISFLNKQFDLLSEKRKIRQAAGSKGGNAKAMLKQKPSNATSLPEQNPSYKDKDNNKDNNKDNDNSGAPSLFEFLEYCKTITEFNFVEYEYSLKSKYQQWVDNDWRDGHDKKIKNWKTKIQNTYPFLTKTQPQKQTSKYIPTERDKW